MEKLLLHSCCAPCSTHVIEVLKSQYDVTIFYYNPNIFPQEEYEKRLAEQKRYAEIVGVKVLSETYDESEFLERVKGLELELRLRKTAELAKEKGFDVFATTLSVSPHKSTYSINTIGQKIADEYGVNFLAESFKKKDGYLDSIRLSKKYDLYRQNYCGCRYSIRKENL